jgi:uncharacterized protein YabN with tetrapyrrole methylase and pyrophosphatase domain
LIDRHPHVFGDVKAETPAAVLRNWEALKTQEKAKAKEKEKEKLKKQQLPADATADENDGNDGNDANGNHSDRDHSASALAGVSSKIPALMEAFKLSSRAANVGFDWPELEGLFDKLAEETAELQAELARDNLQSGPPVPSGKGIAGSGKPKFSVEARERIEGEVGDLFFVLVNIARYLSLDPESALRKTNRKFKRRFQSMEDRLRASGRAVQQASMDELETLWQEAKRQENPRG